jgi:hypothetical protein
MAGSFTLGFDVEVVNNDAVDLLIGFIRALATLVASAAISALVRFCGATYRLTLAPSFRIGHYPTFCAVFLDISLSAAAILATPGSALATLCRRVIQIGSLNESHVLPAASYQTSAFDGRSIPAVCDPCINGVPPRALLRVTQSQGPD